MSKGFDNDACGQDLVLDPGFFFGLATQGQQLSKDLTSTLRLAASALTTTTIRFKIEKDI